MARTPIPPHLKTCEIKRRLKTLIAAAKDTGFDVCGVRLMPDGEITLLDKTSLRLETDSEAKWLGS